MTRGMTGYRLERVIVMSGRSTASKSFVVLFVLMVITIMTGCSTPANKASSKGQIKTPHFLDSFPKHNETFSQTPKVVKINFDFDLGGKSNIKVTRAGKTVVSGKTEIAKDDLSMQAPLKESGDGTYTVTYRAYWPDGSYHDGRFSFNVSSKTISGYTDLTGRPEVTVELKGLRFVPAKIIISKGAKVTWINKESVKHYINSDPHASHNVITDFNSRGLDLNDTYSYTFTLNGEWAYHCSAHYKDAMLGRVVVKEPAVKAAVESDPSTIENLRTPHFVQSTPAHGEALMSVPSEIVIEFNFDLDHDSSIRVMKGSADVTGGPTVFSDDNLTMRAPVSNAQGKGTYIVTYTAYWPDKTYHEGKFAFSVN